MGTTRTTTPWVCLVLAVAMLKTAHAQGSSSPSSPPAPDINIQTKAHRNVCVAPYTALDQCGVDGTVDTFTGYEVEVRVQQNLHACAASNRSKHSCSPAWQMSLL